GLAQAVSPPGGRAGVFGHLGQHARHLSPEVLRLFQKFRDRRASINTGAATSSIIMYVRTSSVAASRPASLASASAAPGGHRRRGGCLAQPPDEATARLIGDVQVPGAAAGAYR